jgi:hypothetical protein
VTSLQEVRFSAALCRCAVLAAKAHERHAFQKCANSSVYHGMLRAMRAELRFVPSAALDSLCTFYQVPRAAQGVNISASGDVEVAALHQPTDRSELTQSVKLGNDQTSDPGSLSGGAGPSPSLPQGPGQALTTICDAELESAGHAGRAPSSSRRDAKDAIELALEMVPGDRRPQSTRDNRACQRACVEHASTVPSSADAHCTARPELGCASKGSGVAKRVLAAADQPADSCRLGKKACLAPAQENDPGEGGPWFERTGFDVASHFVVLGVVPRSIGCMCTV